MHIGSSYRNGIVPADISIYVGIGEENIYAGIGRKIYKTLSKMGPPTHCKV